MKQKNNLFECVVAGKKSKNGCFIGKNRDRTYNPNIEVIHGNYPKLEYVVLYDSDTGYGEGVNATTGIAVLNSALLNGKDFGKNKSPEGSRLLRALLRAGSINELVDLITKKYPVYGCTLIATKDELCIIESDLDGADTAYYSNIDDFVVRANHGILRKQSGYQASDPIDYLSSKTREAASEIIMHKSECVNDMLSNFLYPLFDNHGALNITRSTDYMNTTNQIGIDLEQKIFSFINIPGQQNFKGIRKLGPWKNKPKYRVKIEKYTEPINMTFPFWGTK